MVRGMHGRAAERPGRTGTWPEPRLPDARGPGLRPVHAFPACAPRPMPVWRVSCMRFLHAFPACAPCPMPVWRVSCMCSLHAFPACAARPTASPSQLAESHPHRRRDRCRDPAPTTDRRIPPCHAGSARARDLRVQLHQLYARRISVQTCKNPAPLPGPSPRTPDPCSMLARALRVQLHQLYLVLRMLSGTK